MKVGKISAWKMWNAFEKMLLMIVYTRPEAIIAAGTAAVPSARPHTLMRNADPTICHRRSMRSTTSHESADPIGYPMKTTDV